MKVLVKEVVRGPKNRVFLFNGKGYTPGQVLEVSEEEGTALLKDPGIWKLEEIKDEKSAPVAENKMLKTGKDKSNGTASKRASDPESNEGLPLDFLG